MISKNGIIPFRPLKRDFAKDKSNLITKEFSKVLSFSKKKITLRKHK